MRLDIASLAAAYRARTLTPRQTVDHVLAQIAKDGANPLWISRFDPTALYARADQLSALDPASLPLYGIPFAVKDNIDLQGLHTTAACPDFAYAPSESAQVVQRLLEAGAIAIGKTNLDQFATGLVGTRSPYGICHNAFDRDYVSGGSSSGSALAVATGVVSFALGTDTAGSGRVPAAFNNILGYKPTLGLLSTRGVLPACRSLDAVSIFALTAADAQMVATVAGVFDAEDPWSRTPQPAAGRCWSQRVPRVAVPDMAQLDFFGNDEYAALFAATVDRVASLGTRMQTVDIEPLLQAARLLYEGPWVAERYLATASMLAHSPQSLLAVTRQIIEGGRDASARDAFAAQYRLKELIAASRSLWSGADVLLLPTAGTHYRIAEEQAEPLQLNSNLGRYTNFVNLMDLSAVAVPAGFTSQGLPFGVSLIAPAWHDADLLAFADRLHACGPRRLGATEYGRAEDDALDVAAGTTIDIAVCGAHMEGLPLNSQLTSRGAWRVATTHTAPCYRLFALPGGPPARPGLVRDESRGAAIEIEIWRMPREHYASFALGIPAPLGIGRVRTAAGTEVLGFVCETAATSAAEDITALGGWRAYLSRSR